MTAVIAPPPPRRPGLDVRLIAGREVEEKLRSRSFVLSTLFFLLIVAASIALPALLSDDGPQRYDVAAVGPAATALAETTPDDVVDLRVQTVPDAAAAERLLRDERVEAAIVVQDGAPSVVGLQEVPAELLEALTGTQQSAQLRGALDRLGATPEQVDQALAPVTVPTRLLDDPGVDPDLVTLLGVAFSLLFFFVVFQFGMSIAQGVVQEKESRIVELLVSAVPVRTLLYGKVLGNGGLAFAQVLLLAVVAVGGAALSGESELAELLLRNSGWFLLFFALGFAMLSCLWAAAGAFASRTEELQSTTVPLQALLMIPFFASFYVTDGTAQTVLSFVPLTAPLMMPTRLLQGDAQAWEGAVAALLVLATAALAVRVGERLYRSSLLRTRGRTSLADAWSGRPGGGA